MHNMSHAALSYLAKQKGYTYIWEAAADYELRYTALGALIEASEALSAEYSVPIAELISFSYELLSRFDNKLLGDTVDRVGRDTARKLAKNDRLTGTALLCLKRGISPEFIKKGIRAAFEFSADGDTSSEEVYSYAKDNGLRKAIQKYCGLSEEVHDEAQLIDFIAS